MSNKRSVDLRHSRANCLAVFWFVVFWFVVSLVPLQAQDLKPLRLQEFEPRQISGNGHQQPISQWNAPASFAKELSWRELSGYYPTSIAARVHLGDLQFRATFERIPAETYFQAQAFFDVAADDEQAFAKQMHWRCFRQQCRCVYENAAGEELISSVWVTSFPLLVRGLFASDDPEQSEWIVRAMRTVGAEDAEVQGVLLRTLSENADARVRRAAAGSLGTMRADPAQAAAGLIKAAQFDEDATVRRAAVSALSNFRAEGSSAIPLLMGLLDSNDVVMRCAAAKCLGSICRQTSLVAKLDVDADDAGAVVPLLMKFLRVSMQDADQRKLLEAELLDAPPLTFTDAIQFRNAQGARMALIVNNPGARNIGGVNNWVVLGQGAALPLPGPRVKNVGAGDVKLAQDPTESLRKGAIENLGRLGPAAAEVVPVLLVRLREDQSPEVRGTASRALSVIAPSDKRVVPAIVTAMEDDAPSRLQHVLAAQRLGAAAAECVPAVERLLNISRGRELRLELVTLLGSASSGTDAGRKALLNVFVTDADLEMRVAAALAMETAAAEQDHDEPSPVDVCLGQAREQLESVEQFAKAEAARALGMLGPRAAVAIPDLIEATNHYSFSVQLASVQALTKMGPASEQAVPQLVRLLGEKHWRLIPHVAAEALGDMGPLASDALPALRACLDSSHARLRETAREAISKITPE